MKNGRTRVLWKKILPLAIAAIGLGVGGTAAAAELASNDCCKEGASCCKPGAPCCKHADKAVTPGR